MGLSEKQLAPSARGSKAHKLGAPVLATVIALRYLITT